MSLWSYSPQDVHILLAGFYQVEGYVDGTFITIKKDTAPFAVQKTADGKLYRTQSADATFTVEINLAQSSSSNDVLSKLYAVDQLTGMAQVPLFVKDSSGSSLFVTTGAFVISPPELSFSNSIETRTWTFQCENGSMYVGGNEESGVLEDIINGVLSGAQTLKNFF